MLGPRAIYFCLQEEIRIRMRRDWQANRPLPLWQPLTQPKIIQNSPQKVSQTQAAGKLYGLKWGADRGREHRTCRREGASEAGVVHSRVCAGKSTATCQAKQTNKSKVKGGEIRGESWHIPEETACTFYGFSEVNDIWLETACIHSPSQLHSTLQERGLPCVTLWHNVLRNV